MSVVLQFRTIRNSTVAIYIYIYICFTVHVWPEKKKKAASKGVFDIDFNKLPLIQQKRSFAIPSDLVVISKEVKRLHIIATKANIVTRCNSFNHRNIHGWPHNL